jgi:hypothetical protein
MGEAIVAAYSAAKTVMDIMAQPDAYRAESESWLKDVVIALDQPNGDLDAFELILKRSNNSLPR